MAAEITDATGIDLDELLALIVPEQQRPERNIVYVGDTADGARAELEDLDPPWTSTLCVVCDDDTLVGAALAELDEEIGRAWLYGPWVAGDDGAWDRWARQLLDAVTDKLPASITSRELAGPTANERLRRLADELGWPASEVNHAYVLEGDVAAAWQDQPDGALRGVVPDDLGLLAPLHDTEFPSTYFSAQQLIQRASSGEHTVLVATTDDGRFAGYAAGRVHPDGTAYLDFIAIDPAARGAGTGRRLLMGICGQLLAAASTPELHLTVQDHRAPARALYEALGFRKALSFVGYRSPAESPD